MTKDNTTKALISFGVLFILGAVLISVIADQTLLNTEKTAATSEQHLLSPATACPDGAINESYTYTLTNAPSGWKSEDSDCTITNFAITNSSGDAFTVTTDYVLDADAGTFTLVDTALVNQSCGAGDNITLASYDYCGDTYMADSWGRSVLNTNVGLFAIVLLIGAAALMYMLFGREKGL